MPSRQNSKNRNDNHSIHDNNNAAQLQRRVAELSAELNVGERQPLSERRKPSRPAAPTASAMWRQHQPSTRGARTARAAAEGGRGGGGRSSSIQSRALQTRRAVMPTSLQKVEIAASASVTACTREAEVVW